MAQRPETQVLEALQILKEGGVVAFPTDTVYGVGAHAFLPEAVKKIYQIKGRPQEKPLQLFLSEVSEIEGVARFVSELAWRLAERFLPGGLTLVLWRAPQVPDIVTAGGETVAVRIPAHPVPRELARGLGAPLAATSANRSGWPSPATAEEVRRQIGDRVDFIIDGGRCPLGAESTVVDVTGPAPRIIREGVIPRRDIEEAAQGDDPP